MNLQQLIQSRWETLSPTERSVARTFLERNEELVFMNATELAASLELYPSSITRFAQKLGFKGYPALQQAVRLELRSVLASGETHDASSVLARHLKNESKNILELQNLPPDTVQEVVDLLSTARRVWVAGERSSAGVAHLLAHFLSFLRRDVHHLASTVGQFPEVLLNMGAGDVLVVFTLQRYSQLSTSIAQESQARGVAIVLVSDGGPSPISHLAAHTLHVRLHAVGGFVSLSAMMSVAVLLGIACAENLGSECLLEAEALWERFDLYEPPEQ
jgi:DNA-binding MurR/RpiR family transcriptional regulator